MKTFLGFFLWFLAPISIILLTFLFFPLGSVSVPGILMVIVLLLILAFSEKEYVWRNTFRSLGTLLQVMILLIYSTYFVLIDTMASYD